MIPDASCLLEALKRLAQFEDFAPQLGVKDSLRNLHPQVFIRGAVEVGRVNVSLGANEAAPNKAGLTDVALPNLPRLRQKTKRLPTATPAANKF